MDRLYTRTFEQIRMPEERAARMRGELARRFAQQEQEGITMNNNHTIRRPRTALIAAAVVCALSVSAFAAGGLTRVYHMMTGGVVSQGETGAEGAIEQTTPPIATGEDGSVRFIANGENIDITGQFSYETPYIYDCTNADGARHLFIIGGRPGEAGWSEFILDEDGMPVGGGSQFATSGGSDDAPWLKAGMEQLNLPWANLM